VNYSSDQWILDNTTREGDLLKFNELEFTADCGGEWNASVVITWCQLVRGEYERKEDERTASNIPASAPEAANGGNTHDADERTRSTYAGTYSISENEETVQEFIQRRSLAISAELSSLLAERDKMIEKCEELNDELNKLIYMQEMCDDSEKRSRKREDDTDVGEEVQGDSEDEGAGDSEEVERDILSTRGPTTDNSSDKGG